MQGDLSQPRCWLHQFFVAGRLQVCASSVEEAEAEYTAQREQKLAGGLAGGRAEAAAHGGGGGGGGGESFLRVHWVAVPQAVRARRVNNDSR
eukprot:COSAG01_NODE_6473_length_3644_cov_5174.356841_4_plen_92_part_00